MPWAAFIMALVGPIARRVIISLGFTLVTYVGFSAAVTSILSGAKAAWGGGGFGAAAQLVAMSGANTALGIIAGGIVGRVSMVVLKKYLPT